MLPKGLEETLNMSKTRRVEKPQREKGSLVSDAVYLRLVCGQKAVHGA